jgi:tetratricopeptide (TPR) repeat protein
MKISSIRPISCFALLILLSLSANGQVEAYQKSLTLPTYGVRKPEIMPDWRSHRYPYPMMDRLTNEKGIRTYNALYAENEYVKVLVLPELGGRLHGAQDKTNGYQFLYDQKVIKPGLISLTGAWISGGVEWNFPKGHRPSGFRDTDWTIKNNHDGSKTIWVGEIEKLKRMRWSVGTTVHPGRNWVETRVRLENCTPYIQSFQYWATSAVRATENYQAVIPGEIMTGHGKHEFFRWPVDKGIDISYWKNTPGATSYFAVESTSDFFGGYSPEMNAGMVHVADHHIVRGKKLWTWGTAPAGRIWEKILTDGDLPYFEPQAGAYSDNQPSLHWMMPGETKIFSHFWFPVRDIGVFDYANLEGSINLELSDGKAIFGWSPTGLNEDVNIAVAYDGQIIFIEETDADPANPFIGEVIGSGLTDLYKLKMSVISSKGDTLLAFQHEEPKYPPIPEAEAAPPDPDKVSSQDLLFVYGDRLLRYDDPGAAITYFKEAVRRDPGDLRCNTSLGEISLKNGNYKKALEYFNTSIERDESFFKAWYYKGLSQIKLGNLVDAEKCLNRASYSQEWYAIAHFELAQLAATQNRLNSALEHIDNSIKSNGNYSQAHAIKALILIRMEEPEEALEGIRSNLLTDPLDPFLKQLQVIAASATGIERKELYKLQAEMMDLTRAANDNHLDLAIRFARCGSFRDAINVLELLSIEPEKIGESPLVYYYLANYHFLIGDYTNAGTLRKKAATIDPIYCFPFREETYPVLEWALSENPDDPLAHYLLGNLQYKCNRSQEAATHWERSVMLDPQNAVAQRNLGKVYFEKGDLHKAQTAYQAAINANPSAGKALVELGLINWELKIPYHEQIALFEDHMDEVLENNQAVSQLVLLYILTGKNQEALQLLNGTHFNSWEGSYGIHQLWVQANIKQGDTEFEKGKYAVALRNYEQSMLYPDNLEVAEQPNTIHARKKYKIGKALEALGRKDQAQNYYELVLADKAADGDAYQFYRAKAMEALDKKLEAKKIYEKMLEALNEAMSGHVHQQSESESAQSISFYTRSLALEGLGKKKEAEAARAKAFALNPLVELSSFRPPRAGF